MYFVTQYCPMQLSKHQHLSAVNFGASLESTGYYFSIYFVKFFTEEKMVNKKKVDNSNAESSSADCLSKLRPTRKRRSALVETNANETDSDFVDEKDDVYKKNKQRCTETENCPGTQTVKETANRKTKSTKKKPQSQSRQ